MTGLPKCLGNGLHGFDLLLYGGCMQARNGKVKGFMNAKSRARLAAVPLNRLDLGSVSGRREYRRRMARKARDYGNAWFHQTERPVGRVKLKNQIGRRQRWAWVPKEKGKEIT